MYFSASTIAAVATFGFGLVHPASAAVIEQRAIEQRSTSALFQLSNYGAIGKPWQSSSTPGSFCSSKKPSNSKAWQNIPYFDGGDTLKCTWWNQWWLPICSTGNKRTSLPKGCKPPHSGGGSSKTTATSSSTKAVSSVAASSSAAASSAAASPAVNGTSSAAASSSAAATTSSAAAASSAGPSPTTSSAAASASASADPNPLANPVCELQYQATYLNYTVVAPNGYWTGQTVGAAAQDASYMTYTLATSVDDCLNACSQISGCVFVNTYYDTNPTETDLPKHAPGVFTCAMFSSCVSTDENSNWGGQDDPNVIQQSNGYCRSGACGGA